MPGFTPVSWGDLECRGHPSLHAGSQAISHPYPIPSLGARPGWSRAAGMVWAGARVGTVKGGKCCRDMMGRQSCLAQPSLA